MIFRVRSGYDDIIGRRIKKNIFIGKKMAFFDSAEDIKSQIYNLARNFVEDIRYY